MRHISFSGTIVLGPNSTKSPSNNRSRPKFVSQLVVCEIAVLEIASLSIVESTNDQ